MALEAVVFQQDLFNYNGKDLYNLLGGSWSYDNFGLEKDEQLEEKNSSVDFLDNQTESYYLHHRDWQYSSSSPSSLGPQQQHLQLDEQLHQSTQSSDANYNANGTDCHPHHQLVGDASTSLQARPKRRRSKSRKNKEEIENQRMTHIAVERNRRKQMNEYLSVLRSLMPDSYVQRGDQASIIGGAINFVKELEHRLQLLGAQKEVNDKSESGEGDSASPFTEFFTFPQYSTNSSLSNEATSDHHTQSAIADIEVTMVESHASLKIRSKRRPKQLLKMVSGLHSLRLTILHLNVTTVDQIVLYSLSVKVEDDCKLTSVDDIATAVYQLLGRIREEAILNGNL